MLDAVVNFALGLGHETRWKICIDPVQTNCMRGGHDGGVYNNSGGHPWHKNNANEQHVVLASVHVDGNMWHVATTRVGNIDTTHNANTHTCGVQHVHVGRDM